jgi:hypothetical protein
MFDSIILGFVCEIHSYSAGHEILCYYGTSDGPNSRAAQSHSYHSLFLHGPFPWVVESKFLYISCFIQALCICPSRP